MHNIQFYLPFKGVCIYFLGPAACGGRALAGLAGLLGPAPASWLALPLRGTLAGP